MESMTHAFSQDVEKMRNKRYNLLDESNYFENDYQEFQKRIELFEHSLQVERDTLSHAYTHIALCSTFSLSQSLRGSQVYINSVFENIPNTDEALALLQTFETILNRDNLRVRCFLSVFYCYSLTLQSPSEMPAQQVHAHLSSIWSRVGAGGEGV